MAYIQQRGSTIEGLARRAGCAVLVLSVLAAVFTHPGIAAADGDETPSTPSGTEYPEGTELVVSTDALNLRSMPNLQGDVLAVLPNGTAATVVSGGYLRDGYLWYRVSAWGLIGFAVSDFMAPAGSGGQPAGDQATVATDALNVRVNVGVGADMVAVLPWGTQVTIVAGPIDWEGYTWYRIASHAGNGWVAGEYLDYNGVPLGDGPTNGITLGMTAIVNDGPVNLRAGPGVNTEIVTTLPTSTTMYVSDGPISGGDGWSWVYVTLTDSTKGWVAAEFLLPA